MNRWRYGSFQIGSITGSARVSYGTNIIYGNASWGKQSDAFGSLSGPDNELRNSRQATYDQDDIDAGNTNHKSPADVNQET